MGELARRERAFVASQREVGYELALGLQDDKAAVVRAHNRVADLFDLNDHITLRMYLADVKAARMLEARPELEARYEYLQDIAAMGSGMILQSYINRALNRPVP